MSPPDHALAALAQFDAVVAATPGMRVRDGQRRMAEEVARTFARAQLAREGSAAEEEPARAIAVIEAGTGVGKSLAYAAPAIQMALARGTRVLIATATVALQEQLVHKDLPALAAAMAEPFSFALAKGRARYVCKLKLERLAGDCADDEDGLFTDEEAPGQPPADAAAGKAFYQRLADDLATGLWDGDRDQLTLPPEPALWSPVAAVAHTCSGRHCPLFSTCTYYERRKELVGAQVIVANHDLLLSSIGARLLPDLDDCLLVIDEAHHLPKTALSQFACEMDLSRLGWLGQLASRALRVGAQVQLADGVDLAAAGSRLRVALQDAERLVIDLYGAPLRAPSHSGARPASWRSRVPQGQLPEPLMLALAQVLQHAGDFLEGLRAIARALRERLRDEPADARRLSQLYAQVGQLAPRLEAVHATSALLLQEPPEGAAPAAKWFTLASSDAGVLVRAHASPLLPGASLAAQLWRRVRAAVLTSATLTSCGSFDFFLREAGLHGDAALTTLQVASPFDYARQGTLLAASTLAAPREVAAFTRQMIQALLDDLAQVASGALVLFTSREQMRAAVEQLPAELRACVLVQGHQPRLKLLARHREQVAQGRASIIFGLQSFAEGVDLPGALCEALFITKLPFAPPDEPVDEARAEWLRASGGDPFMELVVPATALRLAQWVGRAIRSEEDRARVVCYDKRLLHTGYGRRLLRGLPAFTLQERLPQTEGSG
ncbi:ATP-dependent DNA helicase DinG [Comamonas sp. NLF-1-9]|uniref:ATP-dependent DNA helicase DinG n=1 Tax=Comamonas sp. NLF-1-9 TaxID=2853163 RepID=UPI001C464504|nr:ATP-dependent DNA helicase DinG [Comamonas sp. NLF-1-9]QXL83988.1 ATP-dependent DNA helicase DinG [Comamonas sp. NLF-1-9]